MLTVAAENAALVAESVGTASGPILVATDGTAQSEGALAVARSLAAANASAVQVVTVQRSHSLLVPDASVVLEASAITKLTADLQARVRRQCTEASVGDSGPALPEPEIVSGEPERVISRLAAERGAQLIVLGLGRHDIVERIFGSETALKVARISRAPVFAVPEALRGAPHRVVVGVDFSEASLHAAQGALQLLLAGGVLLLVHVIPRERLLLDPWISNREYDEHVRRRFARFRARLVIPPNVTVEQETRSGDAARELIAYAAQEGADVIAAGSHGHGHVARLVLGSVSTSLLRAATCAVLVVPPTVASASETQSGEASIHLEPSQWPAILADITRANAGRRTRLEIDDPEIGAQAEEVHYPLLGVVFDPHDQRLEIMLGAPGTGAPHLTHGISGVTSLDLLTDKEGKDVALRAQHGAGQTVLTFLSS